MPRQEWVGIEPMGEVFLLTFLLIGLVRDGDFSSKWKVTNWKSVNPSPFMRTNPAVVTKASQ